ncbi:tset complex member tstf [Anaeramoeba ignava]|uniref:Tset complex member tstf n=1 Tax=Anaeramoeba ignava TaxID=1746090 RepID=A0A9Q0LHT8_ANAIG|nr:tset complex member tstf [Anaeramoeba ignava]
MEKKIKEIEIEYFFKTKFEQTLVVAHPVLPWILSLTENNEIIIWNTTTKTAIQTIRLEEIYEKRIADKLSKEIQNIIDLQTEISKTKEKVNPKIDQIKSMYFVDKWTINWWKRVNALKGKTKRKMVPQNFFIENPVDEEDLHLILIVTQNFILSYDYLKHQHRDFQLEQLQKATITTSEVIYSWGFIALGLSDGRFLFYNYKKNKIEKFVEVTTKPLNLLEVLWIQNKTELAKPEKEDFARYFQENTCLLCGSVDGTLKLFSIANSRFINENKTKSSSYVQQFQHDPVTKKIAIYYADKSVTLCELDTKNGNLTTNERVLKNKRELVGTFPFSVSKDLDEIIFIDTKGWITKSISHSENTDWDNHYFSLSEEIHHELQDSSGNIIRQLKIYCVKQHPLYHNRFICASSKGIIVFVALHLTASKDPNFFIRNLENNKKELYYLNNKMKVEILELKPNFLDSKNKQEKPRYAKDFLPDEDIKILASGTKGLFSVFHKDKFVFEICGAQSFKEHDRGECVQIEWEQNAKNDRFAVLFPPKKKLLEDSGKSKKKKTKNKDQLYYYEPPVLQVTTLTNYQESLQNEHTLSNVAKKSIEFSVPKPILEIHGGMLLGITYASDEEINAKYVKPEQPLRKTKSKKKVQNVENVPKFEKSHLIHDLRFQFYSWTGDSSISGFLPVPISVLFDDTASFCAMIYENEVHVFDVQARFNNIGHIVMNFQSGCWISTVLFLASEKDVYCVFPHKDEQILEYEIIASLEHDMIYRIESDTNLFLDDEFVPKQPRPLGEINFITLIGDNLLLIDQFRKFQEIKIFHPILKFKFLIQWKNPEEAMKWIQFINPKLHNNLAIFLDKRGFGNYCVHLSGVDPQIKFEILLRNKLFLDGFNILREMENEINFKIEVNKTESKNINSQKLFLAKNYLELAEQSYKGKQLDISEQSFEKSSEIDSRNLNHYILFLAKTEQKSKLNHILPRLIQSNKTDPAIFATCFLEEDLMFNTLVENKRFSEAIILLLNSNKEKIYKDAKINELINKWNQELSKEPNPIQISIDKTN